jgi:hypothetical protein
MGFPGELLNFVLITCLVPSHSSSYGWFLVLITFLVPSHSTSFGSFLLLIPCQVPRHYSSCVWFHNLSGAKSFYQLCLVPCPYNFSCAQSFYHFWLVQRLSSYLVCCLVILPVVAGSLFLAVACFLSS